MPWCWPAPRRRRPGHAQLARADTQALAGQTVKLGHLHPTRDLNFVANTVDGFLRAASQADAVGQTINLGSGREISIGDLAQLIGRLLHKPVQVETEDRRLRPHHSEVERLLADNSRARSLLGWEPKVGLEEGLQRTIDWLKEHQGRYRTGVYVV